MSAERTSDGVLRTILLIVAALVLLPALMMAFAMPMMGMMGWWWGGRMAGGVSPFWGLGMMVGWLIVLAGIGYLLYRGILDGGRPAVSSDPAMEELRLAYARGELSEEEFDVRREKLRRDDDHR